MNPTTVVIGGVGALLIYSAIKDVDPRDVIAGALGKPSKGRTVTRKPVNPDNVPIVVPAPPVGIPGVYWPSN